MGNPVYLVVALLIFVNLTSLLSARVPRNQEEPECLNWNEFTKQSVNNLKEIRSIFVNKALPLCTVANCPNEYSNKELIKHRLYDFITSLESLDKTLSNYTNKEGRSKMLKSIDCKEDDFMQIIEEYSRLLLKEGEKSIETKVVPALENFKQLFENVPENSGFDNYFLQLFQNQKSYWLQLQSHFNYWSTGILHLAKRLANPDEQKEACSDMISLVERLPECFSKFSNTNVDELFGLILEEKLVLKCFFKSNDKEFNTCIISARPILMRQKYTNKQSSWPGWSIKRVN